MSKHSITYISNLKDLLDKLDTVKIDEIIEILDKTRKLGKRIFIMGNGGSAATANHFTCDFGKNATKEDDKRFRIISVCDNIEAITAYGNDNGYENVFYEQLKNYYLEENDVLIAISASGNSPNILKAAEYAKNRGACIISLTGFTGGRIKTMSDVNVNVDVDSYEMSEDMHLIMTHIIVYCFKNRN